MKTLCCIVITLAICTAAGAQTNATHSGGVESYATMQCIGVEWTITGDANHNATCQTEYRAKGETAWKKALPLMRLDARVNCFCGSIFNLQPGTTYEMQLQIVDPDGGNQTATVTQQTRPVPTLATNARTFYVTPGTPGSGGGDGSVASPFKGLAAAQAAAQPGDIFLLKAGKYGEFTFDKAGAPGKPIAYKSTEDAEIAAAAVSAANIWFEGLSFRAAGNKDGLTGQKVHDIVVIRNQFHGYHNGILLGGGNANWYIADNIIEGDNDPKTAAGNLSGEGIELKHSSGHVIAHNRISLVADGISYPTVNCDIYGNEIFDVSDDAIETDGGQANVRVWGNRITNANNNVFSWQPMNRGPWYFIRNQVVVGRAKIYKFVQVPDRFVVLHNTFVFSKNASEFAQRLLNAYCRNNLYISYGDDSPAVSGAPLNLFRAAWNKKKPDKPGGSFEPSWMTDVDYDGFDWGTMAEPFKWNDKVYKDLKSFADAVGIEKHAIRVKREEIFEKWTRPVDGPRAPFVHMSLKAGSAAIDAGDLLPNINDGFTGKAPDLGALELGKPLPEYGPRHVSE